MIAGLRRRVIVVEDRPVLEMIRALKDQGLEPKRTHQGLIAVVEKTKTIYYMAREQFKKNVLGMPADTVRFNFKPFGYELDEAFQAVVKNQGVIYENDELICSASKFGGGDYSRLKRYAA